ncbi:transcription initiation protein-like protein spt5 [Massariosphaeria phaeospora]|uniref:Transcription elongation factor SPT5 n=1 Tax=Massariosphaeria phaeospora TaxID=100035 RepID=A0A7C8I9L5_9PLEO|nr:transcription initiation protein-like protein spt5 [Massariosphaeria phaeospora]
MAGYDNRSGSESEDDDFNPQPEIDDDEPTTNGDARRKPDVADEDEDGDQAPAAALQRRDDDDEDEEGGDGEENDDDEDDDEDEEDVVARPAKRRKKARPNQFLDVEAEVDDSEEEEEEGEDEVADEVHPDDLLGPTDADLDDRHHRELDMQRQVHAQKDVEEIARELDERYKRREMSRAQKAAAGSVPLALPTVNDPSIWGVKCRPGKEREIIMAITKRIDNMERAGQIPRVYSAFERGGTMMGYLYVEADAQQDMVSLIESIPNVFMGQAQIAIEVKERPDLLRKRKRTPLEEGKFVRMVRPVLYKGDLAKIVEVHANGLDCTVQLVPRLDYGFGDDANAAAVNKRKRGNFGRVAERPPQKLFNEAEAKKRHMKHLATSGHTGQKTFTYKGDDYQNGFLIKDVKINYVTSEKVNPKMEEMQFFSVTNADGTETLDLVAVQAAQKAAQSGSSFVSGDNVEIFDGEQKGIRGVTVSVTGDIVSLRVTEGELKGRRIEAPVRTLRKLFREGDHVKVIGGSKYIDEVGLVTRIKDDKVTLLCDSTQVEITVFSKDLKRAADSAMLGNDSDFELYDLIQIDAATVGCVVKVDREVLRVVDQHGDVRTLLHTQVSSVVARNRNAVATDRDGSEIRNDDTVKEHGGEGRQGKVVYIHRGVLFVNNRELVENAGVFVVRSQNVTTMAAKSGRAQATGPDLGALNPALNQQGANGTMAMPPPRIMGRDKMIGKTVTIRKGPYKGLLGIVKDTMNDEARIELHTKNKQVSVKKDILSIKDPITGQNMDFSGGKFPNRSRGGYAGSATPNHSGGRTPAWGNNSARNGPSWGATPAGGSGGSGGRTPGWGGSGGRTPGWGGDGGRTAYGGDGGRTAYGGDGSRTAYGGDGSRTAYGGGDGSRTAYGGATAYGGNNDGSRTAYGGGGYNSGGRTPGGPSWGSGSKNNNLSAPTPGAYNPPTPGAYSAPTPGGYGAYSAPTPGGPPMDAPTPGNFSAPTPGDTSAQHPTPRGYGSYGATPAAAPTPGAWADTPWGGAPETPAPSGLDDDPRYD